MPDTQLTSAQVTEFNRWVNHWRKDIVPKAVAVTNIYNGLFWLQNAVNAIGANLTLVSKEDQARVTHHADMYNRVNNSLQKIELGTYGVQFENNDFSITAPAHLQPEQYQDDEVIISETLGWIVPTLVIGGIVIGGTWLVTRTIDKGLDVDFFNAKAALKTIQGMADNPNIAPQIAATAKQWLSQNSGMLGDLGLGDALKKPLLIVAGALGIGVLIYAFTQGRNK